MDTKWFSMEVLEVREETPSLTGLRVVPYFEGARFNFQAGQCVHLWASGGAKIIFAIASEPEESRFVEFLVKNENGTPASSLCRLKPGEHIQVSLPFGKGYPIESLKGKDLLLIGMGSALSSLRSLLKSVLRREHEFGRITLVYGARTAQDVPYRSDFDLWSKKIDVHFALSRGDQNGFRGRVTDLLPKLSMDQKRAKVFVCGSSSMEREVADVLERSGISKLNIKTNY